MLDISFHPCSFVCIQKESLIAVALGATQVDTEGLSIAHHLLLFRHLLRRGLLPLPFANLFLLLFSPLHLPLQHTQHPYLPAYRTLYILLRHNLQILPLHPSKIPLPRDSKVLKHRLEVPTVLHAAELLGHDFGGGEDEVSGATVMCGAEQSECFQEAGPLLVRGVAFDGVEDRLAVVAVFGVAGPDGLAARWWIISCEFTHF